MSLADDVHLAVARVRMAGTDLSDVEVKSAAGGVPRSLPESISAMANGSGGLILLGLDEQSGFAPVEIDSVRLADGLATACAEGVQPPVRAEIDVVDVDGMPVVAAYVPAQPSDLKPCFVRTQGMERGSYVRSHDGDRHLSSYEIHILVASRGQPRDDATVVDGATTDDLDQRLVNSLLHRLRRTRGPVFAGEGDLEVLRLAGVLGRTDARGHPTVTMAGLLALGRYPQQFFPQLEATLVVYPTVDGSPLPDGTRFIDNVALDGPVPVMVATALAALTRNMARRSVIVGAGRQDHWDYPQEALRELVVNALMHRDYHPLAHGTPVQLELFPDRLVITSPGGLHGPVSADELLTERVSSSRNAVLAKLLEDVEVPGTGRTVCENRGSGLLAVTAALRAAGMQPPTLQPSIRAFRVELSNHSLLDHETLGWLARLGADDLNNRQRLALAYARRSGALTNAGYRALTGTDPSTATRELTALGAAGMLVRQSAGRATAWVTPEVVEAQGVLAGLTVGPTAVSARQQQIVKLLSSESRTTTELADELGVTPQAVLRHIRNLERSGVVLSTEERRKSPRNRWTLASKAAKSSGSQEGGTARARLSTPSS